MTVFAGKMKAGCIQMVPSPRSQEEEDIDALITPFLVLQDEKMRMRKLD